jgi:hypothetical protein
LPGELLLANRAHATPSQCRINGVVVIVIPLSVLYVPTAHASVAVRAETAFSSLASLPGLGLGTIPQAGPHVPPDPYVRVPAASPGEAEEARMQVNAPMTAT